MINKKGYLKTFEAVISLLLLLGVIIYSLSLKQINEPSMPEDIRVAQETAISKLESDVGARAMVGVCSLSNVGVLASYLAQMYPTLGFTVYTDSCFTTYPGASVFIGPTDRPVYTTSYVMFDEQGDSDIVIIKIWRKEV